MSQEMPPLQDNSRIDQAVHRCVFTSLIYFPALERAAGILPLDKPNHYSDLIRSGFQALSECLDLGFARAMQNDPATLQHLIRWADLAVDAKRDSDFSPLTNGDRIALQAFSR